MDMEVDTYAFSSASKSLKKHCRIIETMTEIFMKKLSNARQNFDDVNYDRTLASATSVKYQMNVFSSKVNNMDKDLRTLETLVNEYANGGYKG